MNPTIDVSLQFAQAFPAPLLQPHAWLLAQRLQEGHICIDITDLPEPANPAGWYASPQQLQQLREWVGHAQDTAPFILHRNKLYLHRYFQYETNILRHIKRLLKTEERLLNDRKTALLTQSALIATLQADYPLALLPANEKADWSLAALIMAFLQQFTILTGGPGTGKTTTVAKMLWLHFTLQPNCSIALAAPTGKAATRMADSLLATQLPLPDTIQKQIHQLQPVTLHQLLGYQSNSIYFRHNEENPLPYDIVIVDECSMIDVALFAKLLAAIGPNTRLLLLGDKNQLASVEAGSLFGDLCSEKLACNHFSNDTTGFINGLIPDIERHIPAATSNTQHPLAEHIIELQYSHRFNSRSDIGKFSDAVLHNRTDIIDAYLKRADGKNVQIVSSDTDSELLEFIDGFEDYIKENDIAAALQKIQQLRILCAVREGKGGLYDCNLMAESRLKKNGLIQPDTQFYENRPVMITRNNYELGLVNGDIGIVRTIQGEKKLWLDAGNGNVRGINTNYIQEAETVFAMTIHKSQGSEYDRVFIRLPNQTDIPILTRELLYTAVTRAKQTAIIQTSEVILKATAAGSVQRASGINNRMDEI